jgi:hypothetical protein
MMQSNQISKAGEYKIVTHQNNDSMTITVNDDLYVTHIDGMKLRPAAHISETKADVLEGGAA